MKRLLPTLILFSLIFSDITTGKIVDSQGDPIKGAIISHQNTYTYSDNSGVFRLRSSGKGLVTVQHIGYETISLSQSQYMRIEMRPKVILTEDIILTSQLSNTSLKEINSSVTILDPEYIKKIETDHLESHLHKISNLNWSGGTSRPRYFQIRGIGESSHYTGEGPPNFSVGFSVDDIELSGIGMSAMMFDLNQVEVFKGAQSSVYGANAMAGTISLKSVDPNPFWGGHITLGYGSDNNQRFGLAVNTPITPKFMIRTGMFYSYGNGFRENLYLNRTNTNSKSEMMIRTKLNWTASKNLNINMNIISSNLDNGYDTWAPDNNEQLYTYSDRQGYDSQDLSAISIKSSYRFNRGQKILIISSKSKSSMRHSYDGDWGNKEFWESDPYNWDSSLNGYSYDFYDDSNRDRETTSNEIRFLSAERGKSNHTYVLGAYQRSLTESDQMSGYVFSGDVDEFEGEFKLSNFALYSKFNILFDQGIGFDFSSRAESAWLDYDATSLKDLDFDGVHETVYSSSTRDRAELLSGFKALAYYNISENDRAFVSVSTGYKAGGVNQNPFIADENKYYGPEQNISFELGCKAFSLGASYQATLFYMLRENLQVGISDQQDSQNPNSFYYFTSNASSGHNYGAEFEGSHIFLNNTVKLTSSIGYLQTWTDQYEFYIDDVNMELRGNREQSNSPRYTYSATVDFMATDKLTVTADYSFKDRFYLSDSHDFQSEAYHILNLSADYRHNSAFISLWARNIIDARYSVRGFYFELEPDAGEKLYLQWGDPFHIGATIRYEI